MASAAAIVRERLVDSFRLFWSVNGSLQTPMYITSRLGSSKDTLIVLSSGYTFTNSTNYTFKIWTGRPNGTVDSVAANDTMRYILNFMGNPAAPSTTDFKQCGNGRPTLVATPSSNADSILWYDQSTGGNLLGIGRSLLGPYITSTRTFYAQSMKLGNTARVLTTFGGTTPLSNNAASHNGAMFDVDVFNTTNLDSITFKLSPGYNNGANTDFLLYYKTGTHVGSETNSSAWTLLNSGKITYFTSGGNQLARVACNNLLLAGGQKYAFYYTTDPTNSTGGDIMLQNGVVTGSNTDVSVSGRICIYGLFGTNGTYLTWSANVELKLRKQCSNPNRAALTVTVKPRPTGADVLKGSPFNGQFRVGDMSTPDIAEVGKTIVYEMAPPTNFNNADHGSTWIVNSVTARTRFGVLVPNTDYSITAPSGSGNGSSTFTPISAYLDSFITFSVNYSDLGPHFCDSTIKRTVVVAPTPKPNFKFPVSICLGDAILFDNVTTIHSGNASYTWYFGDGDSSDLVSPVHEYMAPGSYQVKLIAKSFPWNVLNDTTITVEVGELPDVKFRVNNKCQGIALTFQNQTTVGNGSLVYDWDFGDNTTHSSATNPSHLYAQPGGYKVTLKADANGCIASLTKNAYSFARPVANFAAPLAPICAGSEVLLPNTSTIALGSQGAYWTFGDGGSSTQFDGKHSYQTPATFDVKLLAVSEFDCKDSITRQVTIKPTPNPDFSGNQFCGKIPTIFTNNTFEALPNPVYNWSFSDGFTSTQKSLTRSWPYEGPFTATLKATYSNNCFASISKEFTVLIQPKANFSVQDICSGESAAFVNTSQGDRGNIQYFWDFGNGTNSNTAAPVRLYNPGTTTTYTVALVASYPAGCSDTMRKTLTVSESPVCDFTFKDLGLLSASFTPSNSTYSKYEWFFGEGGTSVQTAPVYQYLYSGNFNVTMKATNAAGCDCEITKRVGATTSISDVAAKNGISIYPNPNNGHFTVSNAEGNLMKVEVYNVLGEKVYSKTAADGSLIVNLEDNAKGIYLVKITINGVSTTTKITVAN